MPRFGGLGQHRYCCGFSGDAACTFTTLSAEVNMTKTAANVGFAHWSHDVGGFKGNPTDEAYVRWTQAAALWPIYRSHGTKGILSFTQSVTSHLFVPRETVKYRLFLLEGGNRMGTKT